MRVYVIVEGQTEEVVIKDILQPHFRPRGLYLFPIIVKTSPGHKGGGSWKKWENDIRKVLLQQKSKEIRVTSLFDLYGLPTNFPGYKQSIEETDSNKRCDFLEQEMALAINDFRFIPYLQRHEVETLV